MSSSYNNNSNSNNSYGNSNYNNYNSSNDYRDGRDRNRGRGDRSNYPPQQQPLSSSSSSSSLTYNNDRYNAPRSNSSSTSLTSSSTYRSRDPVNPSGHQSSRSRSQVRENGRQHDAGPGYPTEPLPAVTSSSSRSQSTIGSGYIANEGSDNPSNGGNTGIQSGFFDEVMFRLCFCIYFVLYIFCLFCTFPTSTIHEY